MGPWGARNAPGAFPRRPGGRDRAAAEESTRDDRTYKSCALKRLPAQAPDTGEPFASDQIADGWAKRPRQKGRTNEGDRVAEATASRSGEAVCDGSQDREREEPPQGD